MRLAPKAHLLKSDGAQSKQSKQSKQSSKTSIPSAYGVEEEICHKYEGKQMSRLIHNAHNTPYTPPRGP